MAEISLDSDVMKSGKCEKAGRNLGITTASNLLKCPFCLTCKFKSKNRSHMVWEQQQSLCCFKCAFVIYDLHFLQRSRGWYFMTAIEGQRNFALHAHIRTRTEKTTMPWYNRQTQALSPRKSGTLSVGSSCPQWQSMGGLFPSSWWTYLDPLAPLRQAWLEGQFIGWIPRLSNQILLNEIKIIRKIWLAG